MTDLTKALAEHDPEFANAVEENKRKRKLAVTLRSLRHAANLTQTEVAERSRLKQSHVSKLESATGAMPTIETLLKYAAACNAELSLDFNLVHGDETEASVLEVSLTSSSTPEAKQETHNMGELDVVPSSTFRIVKGSLATGKMEPIPLVPLSKDQISAAKRGEKVEIRTEEVIETVVDDVEFHVSLT